jgi:hypothetical protein
MNQICLIPNDVTSFPPLRTGEGEKMEEFLDPSTELLQTRNLFPKVGVYDT